MRLQMASGVVHRILWKFSPGAKGCLTIDPQIDESNTCESGFHGGQQGIPFVLVWAVPRPFRPVERGDTEPYYRPVEIRSKAWGGMYPSGKIGLHPNE